MQDVEVSKAHAFAGGTNSNLRTQFRSYFAFCVYFRRNPLPATSDTICGYVQFSSRSMQPSAIKNYLSGVRTLHAFLGFKHSLSDDYYLQLVLRGIARLHPHVPRRARPVTPSILIGFYNYMDHNDSLHSTVWACGLFLFFAMARLGSILPSSQRPKSSQRMLTRERVNFCQEGIIITLLHTKNIQFGKRRLHIPLLSLNSVLCPVRAYTHALLTLGSTTCVPAFVFRDSSGNVLSLTKDVFIETFRSVVSRFAGGDISNFTGHSFRRGGASWAFQAGVPGELIQVCGDWASDAYKTYLEFSMDNKINLAAMFSRGLPQLSVS